MGDDWTVKTMKILVVFVIAIAGAAGVFALVWGAANIGSSSGMASYGAGLAILIPFWIEALHVFWRWGWKPKEQDRGENV